jgi:hypothetical protein
MHIVKFNLNLYNITQFLRGTRDAAGPGASMPSEVFLSNSIKIKKTPLVSTEDHVIQCRYKGGHFVIQLYMCFEYIRVLLRQQAVRRALS